MDVVKDGDGDGDGKRQACTRRVWILPRGYGRLGLVALSVFLVFTLHLLVHGLSVSFTTLPDYDEYQAKYVPEFPEI